MENKNKSDLEFVCEMQRKIDAYESFINELFAELRHKNDIRKNRVKVLSLLRGTELDDVMSEIWIEIEDMIKHSYVKIEKFGGSLEEFIKPKQHERENKSCD